MPRRVNIDAPRAGADRSVDEIIDTPADSWEKIKQKLLILTFYLISTEIDWRVLSRKKKITRSLSGSNVSGHVVCVYASFVDY